MHEAVKKETFRELVGNEMVFDFARQVVTESYLERAVDEKDRMEALLADAFRMLQASQQDEEDFQRAVAALRDEVFCKGDPDFWFNRLYLDYKQNFKPQRRVQNLLPWLQGETVLDLGCGDGLTALALNRRGFRIYLTDVLDYRSQAAKHLPFEAMRDPRAIPFDGQTFDNALLFAVLHHVSTDDLAPLLRSLHRRARRVIVEEDSYDLPEGLPGLEARLAQDAQLRAFHALPKEDQLRCLMFIDYFANAVAQGLPQMEMPFNFRSVEEWWALFEQHSFHVAETRVMGFQKGFFNRSCHVWFALDSKGGD